MRKTMVHVVSLVAVLAFLIGTAPIASAGQKILLGHLPLVNQHYQR